jgi:hypothetical protein
LDALGNAIAFSIFVKRYSDILAQNSSACQVG